MKVYVYLVVDTDDKSYHAYAKLSKQDVYDGIWVVDIIQPVIRDFDKVKKALKTRVTHITELDSSYQFGFHGSINIISPSNNDMLKVANEYKEEIERLLEKLANIYKIKTVHDLYKEAQK